MSSLLLITQYILTIPQNHLPYPPFENCNINHSNSSSSSSSPILDSPEWDSSSSTLNNLKNFPSSNNMDSTNLQSTSTLITSYEKSLPPTPPISSDDNSGQVGDHFPTIEQITGHAPIMETNINPPRIPSSDIDSIIMTGRHATIISNWTLRETFSKKDTFLFSFQTRYYPEESAIISRIIPSYSSEAITKNSNNNLCFGLGPDLRINLDNDEKFGEVLPYSFQNPILNFDGRFEFEEIEVFQVLRKVEYREGRYY
ncbi:981_t:CDS:2 [Rhizophagus irregularis]|nr:981_t:CDS:2 [Rhizophagus irregularis]